jgi:hypothetical protein
MFIGYAANSVAYRFLVLKSDVLDYNTIIENSVAYRFLVLKGDVLDYNTIIETKNAEFFEHIYPLNQKFSYAHVNDNRVDKTHIEEVRSKK